MLAAQANGAIDARLVGLHRNVGRVVETLPLFPLGTVLLPGASLPLHIFEPRYRQLTSDLMTGTVPSRQFGIVGVRQGVQPATDDPTALYPIGCSALLREVRQLPDGRFDLVASGQRRFRILDIDDASSPYQVGTVEYLADDGIEPGQEEMAKLLSLAARAAHRRYCQTAWRDGDWQEPEKTDPAELAHVLAADCLLALEDKQHLLEETSPLKRLREVRRLLLREAEILRNLRAVPVPVSEYGVNPGTN